MSHILKFLGQASHQNSSLFISISDNPPTTTGLSGHVYLPYLWSGGNGINRTPKGVTLPTEAAVIFLYATWVTLLFEVSPVEVESLLFACKTVFFFSTGSLFFLNIFNKKLFLLRHFQKAPPPTVEIRYYRGEIAQ